MPERRGAWTLGLLCLALAGVAAALGVWQHQRAGLKDRLQAAADERLAQPPLRLGPGAPPAYDELVWRRAAARGIWDRANEILIDSRFHARQPGFHVITPFLAGDRWLLVNRGWYPAPPVRGDPVIPPPAYGEEVAGVLAPDAAGAFELAPDDPAARVWQNLKIATWRARAPEREFYPVVLLEEEPTAGLVPVEPRPDFRAAVSRGYRLQWFGLALALALAWLHFMWRLRRRPRHGPPPPA